MQIKTKKDIPEELTVKVEKLSNLGFGIAKVDGYVIFVEGGCPEDIVKIRVGKKNKSFATVFAKARGVIIGGKLLENENVYSCGYLTRTMRNTEHSQVMYIKNDGADDFVSAYDTWRRHGFRPAIWVKK